jgi:hypothetical protein
MKTENEIAIAKNSGLSLFDTGIFDQMGLIASKLATSSLIPETLRGVRKGQQFTAHPAEQVAANCFRIVEQAQRWGMSPFAVVDCASVVHGKLMWEGKLIAAALEATMKIRLDYDYSGSGTARKVVVSGKFPDEEKVRTVEGSVADWKTDQWKGAAFDQRLAYRGAREWARRYAPAAILGVYSPDEMDESQMRDANQPKSRVELRDDYTPKTGVEIEAEVVENPTYQADEPEPSPEEFAQEPVSNPNLYRDYILSVEETKAPESSGRNWRRFRVSLTNNIVAVTFSSRLGELAQSQTEQWVLVETNKTEKGVELLDLQMEGGII